MSEIKGQLLTMLLVLVAFTAVASVLYGAIITSRDNITDKMDAETSFVSHPTV